VTRPAIITSLGGVRHAVSVGGHSMVVDEPPPAGADLGPTPYELLLAALGT